MILSDIGLVHRHLHQNIITPWVGEKVRLNADGNPVLSYGLSSGGYDLRCNGSFKYISRWTAFKLLLRRIVFGRSRVLDPKNIDSSLFTSIDRVPYIDIPPWSFALTSTVEYIEMPKDCIGIILGKSTYSRDAIICNTTPIEPGWRGHVTIELSNSSPLPVRVYANEGIGQLLICQLDQQCYRDYGRGKYQDQSIRPEEARV